MRDILPIKADQHKPADTMNKKQQLIEKYSKQEKVEWQKVKKKKGKLKPKAPRPDALVIRANSEISYADILKKVKTEAKLNTLGKNVKSIRMSATGNLILELSKSVRENLVEFREAVKDVFGNDAAVRSVAQEIIMDIRDIDKVTTKDESLEALVKFSHKMNSVQLSSIKSLRRAF